MQRPTFEGIPCSIAQALEVVGEWWTPLIVREIFFGRTRFEEIQQDLGIARNTLTARLTRLVEEGILEKQSYGASGRRAEYRLTKAGRDLYPILIALMQWGNTWRPTAGGPPTRLRHDDHDTDPVLVCDRCGERLRPGNLHMEPGEHYVDDDTHPLVRAAANPH